MEKHTSGDLILKELEAVIDREMEKREVAGIGFICYFMDLDGRAFIGEISSDKSSTLGMNLLNAYLEERKKEKKNHEQRLSSN